MNSNGLFSGLYNSFIERDLVYIVGGGILLASLDWSITGEFEKHAELIAGNLFNFLAFVSVCYFLGLLTQEVLSCFGLCKHPCCKIVLTEPKLPRPYLGIARLRSDIVKHYDNTALRQIDRTVFLKHLGGALFGPLVIGFFSICYAACFNKKEINALVPIVMLIAAFICWFENKYKYKQERGEYLDLIRGMNRASRTDGRVQ
jgi:hypothetical protein